MNKLEELRILEEIEDSDEPVFGILPDHDKYDSNYRLVECARYQLLHDGQDNIETLSNEEPIYVRFHDQRHERFLRPILPNKEFRSMIFFDIGPLMDYGQKKPNTKFMI